MLQRVEKQNIVDQLISFILKWGMVIVSIFFGAAVQMLVSNKTKKLSIIENCAIFFSCCLVGGTYAVVTMKHGSEFWVSLSGLVTIIGYNVVTFIIMTSKDPVKLKELILTFLRKHIN